MARKVGAIDLGSNSLRMLAALVSDKELKPLRGELRETRLGEKLYYAGTLYPPARMRTLAALAELLEIMMEEEVEKGIVVATSAVREAADGATFLREMEIISPYPVRLLSGREEARYGFRGAVGSEAWMSSDNVLVLDLGGRSTEFSWETEGVFHFCSFTFGAVSLSETFSPLNSGQKSKIFQPLQIHVREALNKEKALAVAAASRQLIGLGGTVTTLAALANGVKKFESGCVHGYRLSNEAIGNLAQKLSESTPAERVKLLSFAPKRGDIITAGAVAISTIMKCLGIEVMQVSEHGLLHGALREL